MCATAERDRETGQTQGGRNEVERRPMDTGVRVCLELCSWQVTYSARVRVQLTSGEQQSVVEGERDLLGDPDAACIRVRGRQQNVCLGWCDCPRE